MGTAYFCFSKNIPTSSDNAHEPHCCHFFLNPEEASLSFPFDLTVLQQYMMKTIATLSSLSSYHLSLRHSLQACQTGLLPGKQPCAHLPSCHQQKDWVAPPWGFSSLRPVVPPRKMSGQTQFARHTATTEASSFSAVSNKLFYLLLKSSLALLGVQIDRCNCNQTCAAGGDECGHIQWQACLLGP